MDLKSIEVILASSNLVADDFLFCSRAVCAGEPRCEAERSNWCQQTEKELFFPLFCDPNLDSWLPTSTKELRCQDFGERKYVSRCCCSVDHHRSEVFDGSSGRGGSGSRRGRGRRLSRATPEVVAMAVASAIGEEGDAIHKSL
jgi:hypothetical protein